MPRPSLLPSWLIAVALVLAIGLSLSAHAQPAGTPSPSAPREATVELPTDLDAVLRAYERAFRARDAEGLTALFADDGFALPEGRPPVRGHAALRRAFTHVGGPLSLRALAFRQTGDLASIVGAYRFAEVPDSRDDGKFVLTLVRAPGGAWRIFSDIDNGNAPPPAAQAPRSP